MAFHTALHLQHSGAICVIPSFAQQEETLQALRATTSIQPRKGLPAMVSEFREVVQWPAQDPLPPYSRKLSTPFRGYTASANTAEGFKESSEKLEKSLITIGIHRSPEEFIHEALRIGHPSEVQTLFPSCIRTVVDDILSKTHETLARERTAELRRWTLMISDLKESELVMRKGMSRRIDEVLKNKRLALFEQLIRESGHQDETLVKDLTRGFGLTANFPSLECLRTASGQLKCHARI